MPEGWDTTTSIYVFVNKSDAKATTPADDIHFVHEFNLTKKSASVPENHLMDLAPALARLKDQGKWKPGDPIEVTLVLVPDDERPLPADTQVSYKEIVVSLPKR